MPSLLNTAQIAVRTGALNDLFDTVSRPIIIYKEPIKNILDNNASILSAYGEEMSDETEVNYTIVSGQYQAQILYPRASRNQNNSFFDNKIMLNPNSTYIKTKKDARDYIKNGGKTEAIVFDDATWNVEGSEQIQNYLGLQFYYFEVKGTN